MNSATMSGLGLTTSFVYGNNSGELTRVVFPYGGDLLAVAPTCQRR
ncbi:MAG: hypothetical protein JNL98_09335 [Bryobacterales bacterium]|nr:hypothetical protein [Bryobacterales bacterium]